MKFGMDSSKHHGSVDSLGNNANNSFVGILSGMRVYVDHSHPENEDFIIVGARGASSYDSGIFFSPYSMCE